MRLIICSALILIAMNTFTQTSPLSLDENFQLWFLKQKIQTYRQEIIDFWTLDENVRIIIEAAELTVQQARKNNKSEIEQKIINFFKTICNTTIIFTDDGFILRIISNAHFSPKSQKTHTKQHAPKKSTDSKHKTPAKTKGARKTLNKILAQRERMLQEKEQARLKFLQRLKELENIKHDFIEKPKYEFPTEYVANLHQKTFYPKNSTPSSTTSHQLPDIHEEESIHVAKLH